MKVTVISLFLDLPDNNKVDKNNVKKERSESARATGP